MHIALFGLAQYQLYPVKVGHLQHVAQLGPAKTHTNNQHDIKLDPPNNLTAKISENDSISKC